MAQGPFHPGKAWRFLSQGIWEIRAGDLSRSRAAALHLLRVPVLAVRGYMENRCSERALVLTYYTVMSLVPMLALVLGIAKGFGFEEAVEGQLYDWFEGQREVVAEIIRMSLETLKSAQGGIIAGTGLLILFWSAFRVFWNMETAFNKVWGIRKNRGPARMAADYLTAGVLAPVLWLMASTSAVVFSTHVKNALLSIEAIQGISPYILYYLGFLPYCVIWVLLSFVYIFMPNGRIPWLSGVLAGIVAGTLYLMFQFLYIGLQVGVTRINAVYGSFAALPLLLLWVQTSWTIILFGAEFAFAIRHAGTYAFEPLFERLCARERTVLALCLVHRALDRFSSGLAPENAVAMAEAFDLPWRSVADVLEKLAGAGVLAATRPGRDGHCRYIPAQSPDRLTIVSVLLALDLEGAKNLPPHPEIPAEREIRRLLDELEALWKKAESNLPMDRLAPDSSQGGKDNKKPAAGA